MEETVGSNAEKAPGESAGALFGYRPVFAAGTGLILGVAASGVLGGGRALTGAGLGCLLAGCARLLGKRALTLLLICFSVGLVRGELSRLPQAAPGSCLVQGVVTQAYAGEAGEKILLLRDCTLDGQALRGRLRVRVMLPFLPEQGSRVSAQCAIEPSRDKNAGYLRLAGEGTAEAESYQTLSYEDGVLPRLGALRKKLVARVEALFPQTGELAAAILLGERANLNPQTKQSLSGAGISHLIAVSGLHVGILAAALAAVLPIPSPWLKLCCLSALLTGYVLLTGAAPSAARAGIMFLAGYLAKPLTQRPDRLSALFLAAAAILLIHPAALNYAGFQLSFLAVAGLIFLSPMAAGRLTRLGGTASSLLAGTISVSVATLPAMAAFFGAVPLAGLVMNLFVLPMATAFMVSGFAALGISAVSMEAGSWIARLPEGILRIILYMAGRVGKLSLTLPAPSGAACLLYTAAMILCSKYVLARRSTRGILGLTALLGAALCWRL